MFSLNVPISIDSRRELIRAQSKYSVRKTSLTRQSLFAVLIAGSALFAQVSGTPVFGQSPAEKKDAEKRLDDVRKSLTQSKKKQSEINQAIKSLAEERARLNKELLQSARKIQDAESAVLKIESRLGGLREQENLIRGSIVQRNETISKLLAAMQRMGRQPPPVMTTHRQDALKMVRSAMLLANVFPQIHAQVDRLSGELTDLVRIITDINTQVVARRKKVAELSQENSRINELIATKNSTIDSKQAELDKLNREALAFAQDVQNLSELITGLDKKIAASKAAELKKYEAELKRKAELEKLRPPIKPEIEEKKQALALVQPGRITPALPFKDARGLLPQPASGKRIRSFGSRTEYGSQSKGISLLTRSNARITSPNDGWIVYAGPFRSYGQLLIINAGGGYHILLAGMSNIDVKVGQFVLAGEPVATMGGLQANLNTSEGTAQPVLYIEFRKNGKPIDPDPWWAKGPEKAQG